MAFADLPPPPALEAPAFDLAQVDAAPGKIDLRTIKPRCPEGKPGEIVVCATDPEKERARPLTGPDAEGQGLPRAEFDLGNGVSMDVHFDAATLPNGYTANRVMVGFKIKF